MSDTMMQVTNAPTTPQPHFIAHWEMIDGRLVCKWQAAQAPSQPVLRPMIPVVSIDLVAA